MGRIPKRLEVSANSADPIAIQIARVQNEPPPVDTDTPDLDELTLTTLISFFRLLDRWDRERKPPC